MKEQVLAYFVSKYPNYKAIHSIERYLRVPHLAPICRELVDEGKLVIVHKTFYRLTYETFKIELNKINPRTLGNKA